MLAHCCENTIAAWISSAVGLLDFVGPMLLHTGARSGRQPAVIKCPVPSKHCARSFLL